MKITNFEDFKKANGELIKLPISMKLRTGEVAELLIADFGARGRDRIQASVVSMLDKDAFSKGVSKLKEEIETLGDSALCVSLGVVDESNKRYMDNDSALKYLNSNVNADELDKIALKIKEISGCADDAEASAEKN